MKIFLIQIYRRLVDRDDPQSVLIGRLIYTYFLVFFLTIIFLTIDLSLEDGAFMAFASTKQANHSHPKEYAAQEKSIDGMGMNQSFMESYDNSDNLLANVNITESNLHSDQSVQVDTSSINTSVPDGVTKGNLVDRPVSTTNLERDSYDNNEATKNNFTFGIVRNTTNEGVNNNISSSVNQKKSIKAAPSNQETNISATNITNSSGLNTESLVATNQQQSQSSDTVVASLGPGPRRLLTRTANDSRKCPPLDMFVSRERKAAAESIQRSRGCNI